MFHKCLAALCLVAPAAAPAFDFNPDVFTFSGFGTLGTVHSSEDRADFVSDAFQPTGAGYTNDWSFDVDTLAGAQMNVQLGYKLQAVAQVVAQQRYDNSYSPEVEWANLRYAFTNDFSVRVGRIAMPTYLASNTRNVHFAMVAVRPPAEVYRLLPITNSDGVDITYRFKAGSVTNSTQLIYGRNKVTLFPGLEVDTQGVWGIVDIVTLGDLTLHFAFQTQQLNYRGLLAPQRTGIPFKIREIGFNYDPGGWFVTGEYARTDFVFYDSEGGYLHAGYRHGDVTPYVGYARVRQLTPAVFAPPFEQTTVSAGVRWDFMRNFALKVQYEYLDMRAGSFGGLANLQPDFRPGGDANVFSVAVDFIF